MKYDMKAIYKCLIIAILASTISTCRKHCFNSN